MISHLIRDFKRHCKIEENVASLTTQTQELGVHENWVKIKQATTVWQYRGEQKIGKNEVCALQTEVLLEARISEQVTDENFWFPDSIATMHMT